MIQSCSDNSSSGRPMAWPQAPACARGSKSALQCNEQSEHHFILVSDSHCGIIGAGTTGTIG